MSVQTNLIVVRAGKDSRHPTWILNEKPQLDLFVAAFHEAALRPDREQIIYRHIPGSKVAGWNVVLDKYSAIIDNYKQVALIDDDIDMT